MRNEKLRDGYTPEARVSMNLLKRIFLMQDLFSLAKKNTIISIYENDPYIYDVKCMWRRSAPP